MVEADAVAPPPWADLIRRGAWEEAKRALEALPKEELGRPDVRYARARIALARHEPSEALSLLSELEVALPLVTDFITRHRAEAALEVGPFDKAAEYYSARPGARAQILAARGFEKAGDGARAKSSVDKFLSERHGRTDEATARAVRMRVVRDEPAMLADARWIAAHAPDRPEAKEAEALLARLAPGRALDVDELTLRAGVLADAGRLDEALQCLGEPAFAKLTPSDLARLRGDLFLRGKKPVEAARSMQRAAEGGGRRAPEDTFAAARALARGDRDDEAVKLYKEITHRYPKTRWGEEAAFQTGRLALIHGRWQDALAGFDEYLRLFPRGSERRDAERGRAIALFAAKRYAEARKGFEQLSEDPSEPLGSQRISNLSALSAWLGGDKTMAIGRWTELAKAKPLSWPALVARARLLAAGAPVPPPLDPGAAGGAEALLVHLPPPADVLHRLGFDDEAEEALRDREKIIRAGASGRETEALCAAYGSVGRAERRYQIAQQIPMALLNTEPAPRTRWAWECLFPSPFENTVGGVANTSGVPPELIYAVMRQESGFDADVRSPARAVGLLQLLPETAAAVAQEQHLPFEESDLVEPVRNIPLGAHYLRQMLTIFSGSLPLAVAAYNAGPEAVERWLRRYKDLSVDAFVETIPYGETRGYVAKVLGNYARYMYLRHRELFALDLNLPPPRPRP